MKLLTRSDCNIKQKRLSAESLLRCLLNECSQENEQTVSFIFRKHTITIQKRLLIIENSGKFKAGKSGGEEGESSEKTGSNDLLEKNAALLHVYQKYMAGLLSRKALDAASLIRRMSAVSA